MLPLDSASTSCCGRVSHLYLLSSSHMRYRIQTLTVSSMMLLTDSSSNPIPTPIQTQQQGLESEMVRAAAVPASSKTEGAGTNLFTSDLISLQWFITPPVLQLLSPTHF